MPRMPLYFQTLIAMMLGVLCGLWLGPRTASWGVVSEWVVSIIKWVAVPLIFFTIVETLSRAEFQGRAVRDLFLVSLFNGCCAIAIAIVLVRVFHPGSYLPMAVPPGKVIGLLALTRFGELVHENPVVFFLKSPMMAALGSALAMGLLLLSARQRLWFPLRFIEKCDRFCIFSLALVTKVLEVLVQFIPIAVFAAISKVVGKSGISVFGGLMAYLSVCLGGMALQILFVYRYWIVRRGKIAWGVFWKEAKEPVIHGFGINSSLATLPLTLKALDRLGVSESSARLSACVGTNFNNDGILLYEVLAVFFLCQSYGVELTVLEQVITAFVCVVATVGVGGIPEAGVIALTLVLSAVGLPPESLTVLLTVDWVVARCRSFTNVTADMTVAIAIDSHPKTRVSHWRAA